MVIALLIIVGLCLGSFVNAFIWRLHKQELGGRSKEVDKKHNTPNSKLQTSNFSVLTGRSMCPNCRHELAAKDLIPILSWLFLKRRCRYCQKPISWQYPFVELLTPALFVASYILWVEPFTQNWQYINFVGWIVVLVGLITLAVYDARWMILPDKIVFSLIGLILLSLILQFSLGRPLGDICGLAGATIIGGAIFWLIFVVSKGKWIGGGDVKLGILLGLIVAKPEYGFIFLFLASILAMVFTLPLLATKRLTAKSKIPFGPFLIAATIVVVLFGSTIIDAYKAIFGL